MILSLVICFFLTCHDLDNVSPLQDVAMRWLAEENGSDMKQFAELSRNWKRPGFLSVNPCIRFTLKEDVGLTAEFKEDRQTADE